MVKFELADTTVVIETMSGKLKWSDLHFYGNECYSL
jgi:hypothetical protein